MTMRFVGYLLDGAIFVLAVQQARAGYRRGALIEFFAMAGFLAGLLAGLPLVPRIVRPNVTISWVIALGVLFGFAFIVRHLAKRAGVHAWLVLERLEFGRADGLLGAGVGAAQVLLIVWFLVVSASAGPSPFAAQMAGRAFIAETLVDRLPAPLLLLNPLRPLPDDAEPGEIRFAHLEPTPQPGLVGPTREEASEWARTAEAATYRVHGPPCGEGEDVQGTAFAVDEGLLLTNAHVVRAIMGGNLTVGRGPADLIHIDSRRDLAALRARVSGDRTLTLAERTGGIGTQGVVLGFPEESVDVIPHTAAVTSYLDRFPTTDVDGKKPAWWPVYQLASKIEPGNSGGPFVGSDGRVLGMVTLRSTSPEVLASSPYESLGYAIASPSLRDFVEAARGRLHGDPVVPDCL